MNLNKFRFNLDKNNFKKDVAISIVFIACIFFLWKSGIFYSYSFFPVIWENQLHIFLIGLHQLK